MIGRMKFPNVWRVKRYETVKRLSTKAISIYAGLL